MRKIFCSLFVILLLLQLSACGSKAPTWQEQYDLGVRYLEEGNYAEAIIVFTVAIEIDPKQADAYLKTAEAYVKLADIDHAIEILREGWANCPENVELFENQLKELGYFIDQNGSLISFETLQVTAFEAYQEILDLLYYGNLNQWIGYQAEDLVKLKETISYMWYQYPVQSLSETGYTLMDLNNDNVPELITGTISAAADGMMYDLYTYLDGDVIRVTSSGERDRYYLCDDQIIANEGSSGAADSVVGFYTLERDSSVLTPKEIVRFYGLDTPEAPWYYGTTYTYDVDGMEHISAETAMEIIDSYTYIPLVLTLLDQYTPSGAGQSQTSEVPGQTSDLLPIDYLGMTISELTELWGDDYQIEDYWLAGTAKPIYYADVPLMFYFIDPDNSNTVRGEYKISLVDCACGENARVDELAPGLPTKITYAQLIEQGYSGQLLDDTEHMLAEFGETAAFYMEYSPEVLIVFYWYDYDDPQTTWPKMAQLCAQG